MARIVLILTLLFSLEVMAFASEPAVRQIEIKSGWGGLGTPQHSEVLIRNDNGIYRAGRRQVDEHAVADLISALKSNEVPKPDASNLGFTREWLQINADSAALKARGNYADASPEQKSLYRKSFTDPAFIAKVIPSLFNYVSFDDYPSAKVTVAFFDGSSIVASTGSWYQMMLPWEVTWNGQSKKTYNAQISRAVATLMPKKATERDRLSGERLDAALAEQVLAFIEDDWKLIGTEAKAGSALQILRTRYKIITADVNPYHDVVFGKAWDKGATHEENLHVILTRDGFPPHFSDFVILLFENGSVSGTERFVANAKRYEELALSVPWVSQLREKYPKWGMSLVWVHETSFSNKAMQEFAADMHTIGKDALADEVRRVHDNVALLKIGYGDYWIVLPDKRMVLWRYESVMGLLGFKQSEFTAHECSDYRGVTGGCVGAVVSPEGVVQR